MTILPHFPLLPQDQTDWTVTLAPQLAEIHADMAALQAKLEAEATQEGRQLLLDVAKAAGIDITVLGWLDINLM